MERTGALTNAVRISYLYPLIIREICFGVYIIHRDRLAVYQNWNLVQIRVLLSLAAIHETDDRELVGIRDYGVQASPVC